METPNKVGRVRHRNIEKSYGFLRCEGDDYFFHMTSFTDENDFFDAVPGSKVSFIPKLSDRGKQADQAVLVKGK